MKTIAEMDENGDEFTDRQVPAMAAPINVVSAQESIDNQQSIDTMIQPKFKGGNVDNSEL